MSCLQLLNGDRTCKGKNTLPLPHSRTRSIRYLNVDSSLMHAYGALSSEKYNDLHATRIQNYELRNVDPVTNNNNNQTNKKQNKNNQNQTTKRFERSGRTAVQTILKRRFYPQIVKVKRSVVYTNTVATEHTSKI